MIKTKLSKLVQKMKGCVVSLTIWVNLGLYALLDFAPDLVAYMPTLQPHLDADLYKELLKWALIANLLLRFKTKQDLADKKINIPPQK